MNLLLDTHVLVWLLLNDPRLPKHVLAHIVDPRNVLYVSMASLWEMSIKVAQGKLKFAKGMQSVFALMEQFGMQGLPVRTAHVLLAAELPFYHGDPFDRMLIASASRGSAAGIR